MVDVDLAELYGWQPIVLTSRLNAISSDPPRIFMFQLAKDEAKVLRSQIAISKPGRGGGRTLPNVFTEQGVAMLSSVLNSYQAIEVNFMIMRAFVKLRQMLESNEELNRKFAEVIRKLSTHDDHFKVVLDELKKLSAEPPPPPRKPIGFKSS